MRKIKEVLRLRFGLGLTSNRLHTAATSHNQQSIGIWSAPRRQV